VKSSGPPRSISRSIRYRARLRYRGSCQCQPTHEAPGPGRSIIATDTPSRYDTRAHPWTGVGVSTMEKRFEAPTKAEAMVLADRWWKSQKGLKQTIRFVFEMGYVSAIASKQWAVIIHYEKAEETGKD